MSLCMALTVLLGSGRMVSADEAAETEETAEAAETESTVSAEFVQTFFLEERQVEEVVKPLNANPISSEKTSEVEADVETADSRAVIIYSTLTVFAAAGAIAIVSARRKEESGN